MLADRVVIVTGAGRGLGREYALHAAADGSRVVVNDVGCAPDGTGADPDVADGVAEEIRQAGGTAVASAHDMRTTEGAEQVLALAVDTFGDVHGLVNNAGVLRDRMFVNMDAEMWDEVIRGQLRATFCPTRALAAYWRDQHKNGAAVDRSIVNVSSTSGLLGQIGQSNYGAAKAAVGAMTIILAEEFSRYGVRVNGVTPVARTRMTEGVAGLAERIAAPADPTLFDVYHPANVAPLVCWLLTERCSSNGRMFYAKGGEIRQFLGWHLGEGITKPTQWTTAELEAEMPRLL